MSAISNLESGSWERLLKAARRTLCLAIDIAMAAIDRMVSRMGKAGANEVQVEGAGDPYAWEQGPGAPSVAREPPPEGHLVARLEGEAAARNAPHPLTEERLHPPRRAEPPGPPPPQEWLGDLPWAYEDDAFVALARDPATLWIFWDFSRATVDGARWNLDEPRVRLRIFGDEGLVREADVALESRSFYVGGLTPGRRYRAELVFVGRNGERRIGAPSNEMALPPVGPSSIIDDRFVTLPWGLSLARRLDLFARGMEWPAISDSERQALLSASRSQKLGASERSVAGRKDAGDRPWSGSRYEATR
ncbi:DUF4912 domain-containing protein [Vulgatibacter incomptus]|uniref:Alginate regulatory protein AlgP n=1 Tax=Vulgatibacter incomptus TaxID=1391653 RepID=A0A0K1PAU8_9BACT|nr:DUF4912 domain-containing protein [Vulgatibacter incomptus]AKU90650.1 alginate regulatory protein AlgP [Vulgatibacter incomptus]